MNTFLTIVILLLGLSCAVTVAGIVAVVWDMFHGEEDNDTTTTDENN